MATWCYFSIFLYNASSFHLKYVSPKLDAFCITLWWEVAFRGVQKIEKPKKLLQTDRIVAKILVRFYYIKNQNFLFSFRWHIFIHQTDWNQTEYIIIMKDARKIKNPTKNWERERERELFFFFCWGKTKNRM